MFFKSLAPAFIWALFILILCGIPGHRLPRLDYLAWLKPDKIVHLFLYAVFSFLLIRGFLKQETFLLLKNHPAFASVLICTFYGITIEILQKYIFIHRSAEVMDAVANIIGAFIGMGIFAYSGKKKRNGMK